jgi:hypothetical protein
VVVVDVLDLDLLARHGVVRGAAVLARLALGHGHVVHGLAMVLVGAELLVDLGVAVLLVAVQRLDELLDVGDAVGPRVVLPRGVDSFVRAHGGRGMKLLSSEMASLRTRRFTGWGCSWFLQ